MKKFLSLVLAALMLLAAVSALAQDLPIVDEKIEITIAVNRHQNDATQSYDEKTFVKMAEEATNIHVNWIEISADTETKMAAMLAGDMPDAFLGLVTDEMVLQNSGLFAVLNDKIETLLPNFVSYCAEKNIDWKSYMTYLDGNIYGVMTGAYSQANNETDGVAWINQQWLDNLGLEMPTTAEELYDVLVAFRDQDANGNGDPSDEIPMDFCQSHYAAKIWNILSMFGIPDYYLREDGQAKATVNTEAFYEGLTFIHKMAQEGLLNVEGFTQTEAQYNSNLDAGKVGVFCGWAPYIYVKNADMQAQYTAFTPVAAEGYTAVWPVKYQNRASRNGLVINANSKYVDEILKWWNYLSTDEAMAFLVCEGEEGLTYKLGEDGVYYAHTPTSEELIAAGYEQYANNAASSTLRASLGMVNVYPLIYSASEPVEGSTAMARREGIVATQPYYSDYDPKTMVPAEALEEFQFATEGLTDYVDNFIATSVVEGITRESFDAYCQQLETYGYSYYLEYQQKYLDNNF